MVMNIQSPPGELVISICIKYTYRDHRLEIGRFFKVSSFQGQYLERTATSILTSQATTPSPAGLGTSWKTSLALVLSGLYLCRKFLKYFSSFCSSLTWSLSQTFSFRFSTSTPGAVRLDFNNKIFTNNINRKR